MEEEKGGYGENWSLKALKARHAADDARVDGEGPTSVAAKPLLRRQARARVGCQERS